MTNLLRNPMERMNTTEYAKAPINKLSYEISEQDLNGVSGSGMTTAIQLTLAGKCGSVFTVSYECTSNNISCGK